VHDEDDDAFFIKNRGRTAEEWKRLDELTRGEGADNGSRSMIEFKLFVETKKHRSDDDSEDDSDGSANLRGSPRKHKQKRARKDDGGGLPAWARANKLDLSVQNS
jgi:hypothetical protein